MQARAARAVDVMSGARASKSLADEIGCITFDGETRPLPRAQVRYTLIRGELVAHDGTSEPVANLDHLDVADDDECDDEGRTPHKKHKPHGSPSTWVKGAKRGRKPKPKDA